MNSFNELYETSVWKVVMGHIDQEQRIDGEVAYVVKDMGDLIVAIMNFYGEKNSKA